MLCESVIGQVNDDAPGVDWIDIDWTLTLRRALRLTTQAGRRVNVLLPRNTRLRHGDVLAIVDGVRLAVRVRPVDLLVVTPTSIAQAIQIAGELGNLHVPIQNSGAELIVPDDGPTRELLDRHGAMCRHERTVFCPQIIDRSTIGSAG